MDRSRRVLKKKKTAIWKAELTSILFRTKESMTFLSWINGHSISPHQQSEGMPTDMAKAFLTKHFWVCSRVQKNKLIKLQSVRPQICERGNILNFKFSKNF